MSKAFESFEHRRGTGRAALSDTRPNIPKGLGLTPVHTDTPPLGMGTLRAIGPKTGGGLRVILALMWYLQYPTVRARGRVGKSGIVGQN